MAIIAGSGWYIWQQLKSNFPKVEGLTHQSINKLIDKINPQPKPAAPVELKPLAQLTITPPTIKNSNAPPPAPITLNVHGIMSNGTAIWC